MTNDQPSVDILPGDILTYYHLLAPSATIKEIEINKSFGLVLSKPVWKPGFTLLSNHLRLEIFNMASQRNTTWIFYDSNQYRLDRLRNGVKVQIIYGIDTKNDWP